LTYKLPVAYSRDLQEDKKVIFEAFDTSESMLAMMELMVRGMRLDDGAIRARLAAGFMDATALMELLIKHGMPMRQAHEVVGHAVGFCEKKGLELAAIAPADWARLGVPAGVDPAAVLGVERAVRALASYGSSGPDQVKTQLAKWDARLRD
jgi:argininosuccinate lyase